MGKEWDMLNTRVNWVVNQTLCGCEEEEMSDLTFDPSPQNLVPPQHMEHLGITSVHCADASSLSGLFLENSWSYRGHLVSYVMETEQTCQVAATILWRI